MSGLPPALGDIDEVRAHLVAAASAGHALTYSELLELLGFGFSRPKMRALCVMLGVIDHAGAARSEPELAVLVVRQSDGLPGQGWWMSAAREHDHAGPWDGPQAAKLVKRLQQQTFAYWGQRSP